MADEKLGSAYVEIGADLSPLDRGFGEAKRKTEDTTNQMTAMFAKVGAAAAAMFAGSKIFETLKESTMIAARVETLGVVLGVVGKNAGYTREETEKYVQSVSKLGITTKESYLNITKMIQAHIDLSQATGLARMAQDAAVIAETNSSEAFARMVYGIQSAEVGILRTMGINVSFEESYSKLALQLKRNTNDLNELEKTQARTNAVVAKAPDIAGVYESAMGTTSKAISSLTRFVEENKRILGELFSPALGDATRIYTQLLKETQVEMEKLKKSGDLSRMSEQIRGVIKPSLEGLLLVIKQVIAGMIELTKYSDVFIFGAGMVAIATVPSIITSIAAAITSSLTPALAGAALAAAPLGVLYGLAGGAGYLAGKGLVGMFPSLGELHRLIPVSGLDYDIPAGTKTGAPTLPKTPEQAQRERADAARVKAVQDTNVKLKGENDQARAKEMEGIKKQYDSYVKALEDRAVTEKLTTKEIADYRKNIDDWYARESKQFVKKLADEKYEYEKSMSELKYKEQMLGATEHERKLMEIDKQFQDIKETMMKKDADNKTHYWNKETEAAYRHYADLQKFYENAKYAQEQLGEAMKRAQEIEMENMDIALRIAEIKAGMGTGAVSEVVLLDMRTEKEKKLLQNQIDLLLNTMTMWQTWEEIEKIIAQIDLLYIKMANTDLVSDAQKDAIKYKLEMAQREFEVQKKIGELELLEKQYLISSGEVIQRRTAIYEQQLANLERQRVDILSKSVVDENALLTVNKQLEEQNKLISEQKVLWQQLNATFGEAWAIAGRKAMTEIFTNLQIAQDVMRSTGEALKGFFNDMQTGIRNNTLDIEKSFTDMLEKIANKIQDVLSEMMSNMIMYGTMTKNANTGSAPGGLVGLVTSWFPKAAGAFGLSGAAASATAGTSGSGMLEESSASAAMAMESYSLSVDIAMESLDMFMFSTDTATMSMDLFWGSVDIATMSLDWSIESLDLFTMAVYEATAALEAMSGSSGGGGGLFESIFNGMFGGGGSGSIGYQANEWATWAGMKSGGILQRFGKGTVLTRPTIFPMAKGFGLAGEAGYEGVLPLSRTSSGELGVRSTGKKSSEVNMEVKVINESGVPVEGQAGEIKFDGAKYVINVHLKKLREDPNYRAQQSGMQGMFY